MLGAVAHATPCALGLLAQVEQDPVLSDYVRTGNLIDPIDGRARTARALNRLESLGSAEREVLTSALADLDEIDARLAEVRGSDKAKCTFETEVHTLQGFTFTRLDYIGRHVISITRPRNGFFWTVQVHHEGDFWRLGNGVRITGYSSVGTNGSLADVEEALSSTAHLFPSPEL